MVLIDVIIAERVNELANFQPTYVRDHMSQQSVGTNIERHAKECISRPLIKLTMQQWGSSPTNRGPRAGGPSGVVDREGARLLNFELKQRVTGMQVDVIAFARIPAADD